MCVESMVQSQRNAHFRILGNKCISSQSQKLAESVPVCTFSCLQETIVKTFKEQERLIVYVSSRTFMVKNKQDEFGTNTYTRV
jgi:hypothetical protein